LGLETLGQSIINGLAARWIYVLVAVGLALIFSIMGVVQLAHGEIYMLGAYSTYYLSVEYGLNYWGALLVFTLIAGILGVILEGFFSRSFRGRFEPRIIVSIGLMLLLQTAALVGSDTSTKTMPRMFPGILTFWSVSLSWDRLADETLVHKAFLGN
jgi:branched-chain amino acid transport system permease protein